MNKILMSIYQQDFIDSSSSVIVILVSKFTGYEAFPEILNMYLYSV